MMYSLIRFLGSCVRKKSRILTLPYASLPSAVVECTVARKIIATYASPMLGFVRYYMSCRRTERQAADASDVVSCPLIEAITQSNAQGKPPIGQDRGRQAIILARASFVSSCVVTTTGPPIGTTIPYEHPATSRKPATTHHTEINE
jgi:hypothetical protein